MGFFIKRSFISMLTLVAVLGLTFLLLHTVPGGPFDQERQLSPEIEARLLDKYGLSKRGQQNFWVWFGKDARAYAAYLSKGELGPSLKYRDRDVAEIIKTALGPSLELGMMALVLATLLGVGLAMLEAFLKRDWVGQIFQALAMLGVSLPSFVTAVFLVMIFCFHWSLLPPALWEGSEYRVLPVLTLTLAPLATLFQLASSGFQNEMGADYIRTARAKGVSEFRVLSKHAFKNTLTPILTMTGPLLASLITGSFIVETIFAIPGLGRHFVVAVIDRDYFLVMGITFVYASFLILFNWLVDLAYLIVDPRMREER